MILIYILLGIVYSLTHAKPDSYAAWAANSAIARGQGNGLSNGVPLVAYDDGEFQWALRLLYERDGNESYLDYVTTGANNIVFDNGTVHGSYDVTDYVLDPLRTGPTFLYLYNITGEPKWKTAVDIYRSQLDSHPRTAQGQFWHKLIYPNQGWLDGIYMGEVFYAQYTHDLQPSNTTAWDDITSQFQLMFQNTIQNATAPNNTHLMYHGYDYSHVAVWASPDRGHSPEVWDRALGWYMMALVDVLDIIPTSHPGYAVLLHILQTLTPHVRDAADRLSGVWWLVITQPGRAGNYFESSGSAMFVYALLKAVRLGRVQDPDGSIVGTAKKAYGYMVQNWVVPNADGTMSWNNTVVVGSLNLAGDFDYYISQPIDINDLKGLAAFVLASIEYEKL
ncbi:glycoside hydrolase family 105 protein [Lentinula aff. detonsa]|uniref:Glycoside hydrolase family 105 protein n=1 Tax=Lentinula aff. detonsa TaxID=2804958 RepID=A0AA38KS79_9AGAR|nr:glycoside hydrolase family 105 protein [Lentinula aff. detonsa]